MSWYEKATGHKPLAPPFKMPKGQNSTFAVKFLEPEPRVVMTKHGNRPVILVEAEDGIQYSWFLTRSILQARVLELQQRCGGSLEGVKAQFKELETSSASKAVNYEVKSLLQETLA